MIRTRLSHTRLVDLLSYNRRTGQFTWNRSRGRSAKQGAIAGTLQPNGQRIITIDGAPYLANRLAWFYVHKEWPSGRMTFENRNPADNSFKNLALEADSYSPSPQAQYHRKRRAGLRERFGVDRLSPKPAPAEPVPSEE